MRITATIEVPIKVAEYNAHVLSRQWRESRIWAVYRAKLSRRVAWWLRTSLKVSCTHACRL